MWLSGPYTCNQLCSSFFCNYIVANHFFERNFLNKGIAILTEAVQSSSISVNNPASRT